MECARVVSTGFLGNRRSQCTHQTKLLALKLQSRLQAQ